MTELIAGLGSRVWQTEAALNHYRLSMPMNSHQGLHTGFALRSNRMTGSWFWTKDQVRLFAVVSGFSALKRTAVLLSRSGTGFKIASCRRQHCDLGCSCPALRPGMFFAGIATADVFRRLASNYSNITSCVAASLPPAIFRRITSRRSRPRLLVKPALRSLSFHCSYSWVNDV